MSLKRLFCAAVVAVVSFSGAVFAQSSTNSASSASSPSAPGCDDACCFKQSVVDGRIKFECVANWCQASCELVYPKGQDGKPDLNKKPSCGCQAGPPPQQPPPPGNSDNTNCASKTSAAQCGGECHTDDGKVGQCIWVKDRGKGKGKDAFKCDCALDPCRELGVGPRCGGRCTGEITKDSGVCREMPTTFGNKGCRCDNGNTNVINNVSSGLWSGVSSAASSAASGFFRGGK